MNIKRSMAIFISLFVLAVGISGCADMMKDAPELQVSKLAEYTDRLGQANLKIYMYSGEASKESVEVYTKKLGCNMLLAYFYPDTVPLNEIPVEEVRSAKSFGEARDALFNGEGYSRWRFASQCLATIPVVVDCYESSVSAQCR